MNCTRGVLSSLFIGLLMLCLSPVRAELTQGSLYRGQVEAGHRVLYKDKEVMTTDAGHFVLGFGRDAKLKQFFYTVNPQGKKTRHDLQLTSREYKIQRIKGVARKYVKPPEHRINRIRKENRQVGKARQDLRVQSDFLEGFLQPVDGPVTGVYGSQRYFNGEPRRPHYGIDYAAPVGTTVLAPAAGIVTLAHPEMYFSGGTMIIDHGMGVNSSFLHLSKLLVKKGDVIRQGQPVAEVGATGRVTGAHLDWRVNWGAVRLDPALVLQDFPVGQAKP